MLHHCFSLPQGAFGLVAEKGQLVAIIWRSTRQEVIDELAGNYPNSQEGSSSLLNDARQQIEEYLAGKRHRFDLPYHIMGVSPFQQQVLETLCDSPYGSTITYGELAQKAGRPKAARAVGAAMAANPLPLVIPCHRVVGAGQKLTGFSGGEGVASKKSLLALEREN